ncbi:MAG TPA: hypothetical protein VKR53_15465, partial [Puia sp.]|nr:hypothetical protein [Puia sp.]
INQALSKLPQSVRGNAGEIFFTDLTGDDIKLEIRYWIDNVSPENYLVMRDKIIGLLYDCLSTERQNLPDQPLQS